MSLSPWSVRVWVQVTHGSFPTAHTAERIGTSTYEGAHTTLSTLPQSPPPSDAIILLAVSIQQKVLFTKGPERLSVLVCFTHEWPCLLIVVGQTSNCHHSALLLFSSQGVFSLLSLNESTLGSSEVPHVRASVHVERLCICLCAAPMMSSMQQETLQWANLAVIAIAQQPDVDLPQMDRVRHSQSLALVPGSSRIVSRNVPARNATSTDSLGTKYSPIIPSTSTGPASRRAARQRHSHGTRLLLFVITQIPRARTLTSAVGFPECLNRVSVGEVLVSCFLPLLSCAQNDQRHQTLTINSVSTIERLSSLALLRPPFPLRSRVRVSGG